MEAASPSRMKTLISAIVPVPPPHLCLQGVSYNLLVPMRDNLMVLLALLKHFLTSFHLGLILTIFLNFLEYLVNQFNNLMKVCLIKYLNIII